MGEDWPLRVIASTTCHGPECIKYLSGPNNNDDDDDDDNDDDDDDKVDDSNTDSIERHKSRFFTIYPLHRLMSPTRLPKWRGRNRVQITCNTPSAHHARRVVCHVVRRESPAIKFEGV